MTVYLLYVNDWETDQWIEGIYSTREKAEEARKLVSPRFRSWVVEEKVQ